MYFVFPAAISAPVITRHPASSSVELYTNNANLTLRCEADGYQITFIWTMNGKIIGPNDHFNMVDGNLTIINVKPSDQGRYQCTARNSGGSVVSAYANVAIKGTQITFIKIFMQYYQGSVIHTHTHTHTHKPIY